MFEKYDNCWFEIKSDDKRIVTRDHDNFMRNAQALSRLHNIALYRIENGRRSRIFLGC